MINGISQSPLQIAELAIREAEQAPDGDVVGYLLARYERANQKDRYALVAALAGRVMVEEARRR